jgi:hypothetical protein
LGKIVVSSVVDDNIGDGDDSIVDVVVAMIVVGGTSSFFSSSITFFCSIGALTVSDVISFFFFSAAFAPKHDAHKPPVDFLTFGVFSFVIISLGFLYFSFVNVNVGNGPGLTNSISGKSTGAPCKLPSVTTFVTVDSSLFVNGITIGLDSG